MPSLKKTLLTAVLVLSALQVRADVWSDCMFDTALPDTATRANEFRSTGYFDSFHSRQIYWGAFAGQGGFIDNNPQDSYKNGDVYGDIGVAGNGNIKIATGFTLHKVGTRGGDLYYRQPGSFTNSGGVIQGQVRHDAGSDSILDKGQAFAIQASDYAFSLPATPSAGPFNSISTVMMKGSSAYQNVDITANGPCTVLNLQNFSMQGGTFNINGGMNNSIIINVKADFVMNGNAQITLSGGLKWDNVLFNVDGTGNVVSLDQNAQFTGILLSPKRALRFKGASIVRGIAIGEKIELASLSQIIHPSVTSQ